mgnify:CR=1 FL=1
MFTASERKAVGKLIVAAERVLDRTDVNTPQQVETCREQIIDDHVLTPRPWLPSGLSAEQMAELVLEVTPC